MPPLRPGIGEISCRPHSHRFDRRFQTFRFDSPAFQVVSVKTLCEIRRLCSVRRRQQRCAQPGFANAAARIHPGAENKTRMVGRRMLGKPRNIGQRRNPFIPPRPHDFQPLGHESPIDAG